MIVDYKAILNNAISGNNIMDHPPSVRLLNDTLESCHFSSSFILELPKHPFSFKGIILTFAEFTDTWCYF